MAFLFGCGGAPSADDTLRSQKEYELAVGLLQEQNAPGAYQHLFKALELDSDNDQAHLLLGNLYMMRGENRSAEKHLREVLRIQKRSPEARNSLGVLYISEKRYDDAVRELRYATEDLLNREPHLAWGNLGWAYYEKGSYKEAIAALEQSVRYEKRFCLGYYRLGLAHAKMQDLAGAEEAFTRGLEVKDAQCKALQDAWYERGQTRAKLGKHEDAVADFEHCIEIRADGPVGQACSRSLQSSP